MTAKIFIVSLIDIREVLFGAKPFSLKSHEHTLQTPNLWLIILLLCLQRNLL